MKKLIFLSLFFLCSAPALVDAQNDERVLFSVNGDAVSVHEFLTVFNKNNYSKKEATTADLKEYLELYVKFKLKVQEAYALGLDTSAKFKRELENYRTQLSQPYLRDKESNEALLLEAYERTRTERRASHIMIRVEENAAAADSLAAFKKATQIRERLLKGDDFNKLARELSEDPSAKDNAGDLGFFSAFRMIYAFEDMAYETKIGQISPVFRTQYGYHILKATDERSARGEIRVAHLMLVIKNTDTDSIKAQTQKRIQELYKKIKADENFEQLVAQYSEDPSSSTNKGLLPYFGSGRMVAEFEEAAFGLKNDGDVSEPILTPYGWHIIKRVEIRSVPLFEQAKADLEQRIARDARANINKANLIAKLKAAYKFTENLKARQAVAKLINEGDYRENEWKPADFAKDEVVMSFGEQKFKQSDLVNLYQAKQPLLMSGDFNIFLEKTYLTWVEDQLLTYEDGRLESKYDDFRALMKEYREGILLFDLTDQMVWSKAVTDTTGLKAFHDSNGSKYMYKERTDADIFTVIDAKTAKSIRKAAGKKKNTNEKLLASHNNKNPLTLKINSGKYEAGSNTVLELFEKKTGLSDIKEHNGQFVFVRINALLEPSVKPLSEIRGLTTSDYQQYLELEWIQDLESRYKVVINNDTFNSLLPK